MPGSGNSDKPYVFVNIATSAFVPAKYLYYEHDHRNAILHLMEGLFLKLMAAMSDISHTILLVHVISDDNSAVVLCCVMSPF